MLVLTDQTTSRGTKCSAPAPDPEYALHPSVVMMPDLPEARYQALKAGIRDHGLQHPIEVLKGTCNLLRGRHRLRACRELGIEPKVEEVDIPEEDVGIYTGAEAAKRDGLTPTQKVLVALALLPEFERRAAERQTLGAKVHQGEKGKAAELAASLVGVSTRYVQLGVRLRKERPDLFERVRSGDLDLAAAMQEAAGKESKPNKLRPEDDDRFRVPEYLREPLAAVTEAVGGDVLGDGLAALLDFIAGEGLVAWESWAAERRKGAGR